MFKLKILLIAVAIILYPHFLFAQESESIKGFHTGPYLVLDFGALHLDDDHNRITNTDIGNPVEPSFGLSFGWNINDSFAFELNGRYVTNFGSSPDGRQHAAEIGIGPRWTFISKTLTKGFFKVLPQLIGGITFRIEAYPVSPDNRRSRWGGGPYAGLGCMFLVGEYFYFGVDGRAELLFMEDIDSGGAVVFKGGFKPQGLGILHLGVHY